MAVGHFGSSGPLGGQSGHGSAACLCSSVGLWVILSDGESESRSWATGNSLSGLFRRNRSTGRLLRHCFEWMMNPSVHPFQFEGVVGGFLIVILLECGLPKFLWDSSGILGASLFVLAQGFDSGVHVWSGQL